MTAPRINPAALQRLLDVIGGDREDLQELLDDYLETAPRLVAEIRAGAEARDPDAMRIAAHTLKSNAREFGAMKLSALCQDLEHACRDKTVTEPLAAADEIEAEERAASAALAGTDHVDG
jgi:HPt (histidine-containing phosphotransfer) domain-containing protein